MRHALMRLGCAERISNLMPAEPARRRRRRLKQESSAKPTPATHQLFSHQRINVYGIMSQKENGKSFKVSKTGV